MRGPVCEGENRACLGRTGADVRAKGGWSKASVGICSLPNPSLPVSFPRSMVCSLLPTNVVTLPK